MEVYFIMFYILDKNKSFQNMIIFIHEMNLSMFS